MDLVLKAGDAGTYHLDMNGALLRCAIGKGGVRADKREGDGATPVGRFPLRRTFYRKDRLAPPLGSKTPIEITADLGWSDDPADAANYNRLVTLPYAGSHERLMREDAVYDVVVELGYNDDPPVPGRGSAIFMHVARPDYSGTEGCVALALPDLLSVLQQCGGEGTIVVPPDLA
ncbi:L,D-transpeptidase family protein [Nisaea sp.]|uniref:L,D-transpeptidase family protein n=1 Tax=Nisaea sp. TaxID=2024842 RepID=UPI003B51F6C3